MDARMIENIRAAEEALANREREDSVDNLPDGDPLKRNIEDAKNELGDLSGLPDNHPLIVSLEEARRRYESKKEVETKIEEKNSKKQESEVKRARRLDASKERARRQREAEEEMSKKRSAAESLNDSIIQTIEAVNLLRDNLRASNEDIGDDIYVRMKINRLNNLLNATERGLIDNRLNPGRVVNG